MKDKILYLVLGILIGAVITAGCFLIFSNNNKGRDMGQGGPRGDMSNRMQNGMPQDMPSMPSSSNTIDNSL